MQQCNEVFKINSFISNFKVIHCNIRSIHKNFDELKILLSQMEQAFDCIILSETHQIQNLGLYKLDGYSITYINGSVNQNDGVVIYLRSHINYKYKVVSFHEISLIQIVINYHNTKIYMLAAYRSPSLDPVNLNIDLYQHLQSLKTTHMIIIS